MKLVTVMEDHWHKVEDLVYVRNKFAPEIADVTTGWGWPYTIHFFDDEAADIFVELANEVGVTALVMELH